jgi:hypothetical protein
LGWQGQIAMTKWQRMGQILGGLLMTPSADLIQYAKLLRSNVGFIANFGKFSQVTHRLDHKAQAADYTSITLTLLHSFIGLIYNQ